MSACSDLLAEDLAADRVQQQARRRARVARVLLDQRAGGQDGRLVHLVDRHAVVQVALGLGQDRLGLDVGAEAGAGRLDQRLQALPDRSGTRWPRSMTISTGSATAGWATLLGALLRAPLAVQHVGARDFVVAAAHQAELDVVLHVLDVEGAAARTRAQQCAHRPPRSGRRPSRARSPTRRPACHGPRGRPSSARRRSCSARTRRRRRCDGGSGSPGRPRRRGAGTGPRRGRSAADEALWSGELLAWGPFWMLWRWIRRSSTRAHSCGASSAVPACRGRLRMQRSQAGRESRRSRSRRAMGGVQPGK